MNFQTSKRIMCCLMAALILCCAVVRPIEASATSIGATIATGTLIGLTKGQAIAGVLAALGIGVAGAAGSGAFEDLVTDISENVPSEFIIETMSGTEMVEGTLYQDICYVGTEFVEWVNEQLYNVTDGETPILSTSYTHTGEWADYYQQAQVQWPEDTAIAETLSYCTYITYENGSKEIIFSNNPVKIVTSTTGSNSISVNGCLEAFCINDEGLLSSHRRNEDHFTGTKWTDYVTESTVVEPTTVTSNTTAISLSDRISTILDGQTYVEWLANALTLADTTTAVLPISLGDTIADTGAISQTIAQTGTLAPADTYEKTEDIVYVEVPEVSNDLSGIIALLKAILEVLNNIYQTCAVSIKSWIEANAEAIIAANSGIMDANTVNTQAIVDALSDSDWYIGQKLYDLTTVLSNTYTKISQIHALISTTTDRIIGTITDTIAEVIAKLAALGLTLADILAAIKALALSITDAITAALTWAFVPSAGYFDAKVDSLMNAFPFFSNAMDTATQLKNFLFNLGSTPPIIYIDLAAGSGWYPMGGRTVFVDLTWYSAYKPTMDAVISAFLWLWFAWRLILSLPGIIQGTSGFWGQPLAMNPNGYLPSHGTVNETGISVKK